MSISPGPTLVDGRSVYEVRKRIGRSWRARRRPRPTSSCRCPTAACRRRSAIRQAAGIPFELGIIRNHYVGRTFIEPDERSAISACKLKHNANRAIAGKRVVLVDDIIVRGTTSMKIVQMVREAGATEVHMRIA